MKEVYPSNWLYNVGVIGLLKVLEYLGESTDKSIANNGSVTLSITKDTNQIFKQWADSSPRSKKGTSLTYGWKKAYYANQTEKSIKARIDILLKEKENNRKVKKSASVYSCTFCSDKVEIKVTDATFLNQAFGNILLGSEKSFCNMYWNNSAKDFVCPKCEFILMCHHLALTRLSDGSEVFINAPSFKVMYHLNKFAKEALGSSSSEEVRSKREILAMSMIEYATKIQATLGVWTGMNLEIIIRRRDKIEFFSLPYDVIQLLSDRQIASILSDIGEFKILNLLLKQDYSQFVDLGYRLLRKALSAALSQNDWKFINDWLYLDKNKYNLKNTSEKIFRLYALIENKLQRSNSYGNTSIAAKY